MTKIELETISDIYAHVFIEKSIRGGTSYIAKRHSKINACENSKKKEIYHLLGCK